MKLTSEQERGGSNTEGGERRRLRQEQKGRAVAAAMRAGEGQRGVDSC